MMFAYLAANGPRDQRAAALCRDNSRHRWMSAAATLALSVSCGLTATPSLAAESARSIHIPARPLDIALLQLSGETGVVIVADPALVAGKVVSLIEGAMTAQKALGRLLRGTGLSFRQNPDDGYVIVPVPARKTAIASPTKQASAGTASAQPNSAEREPVAAGVEDIIVTAQRREERLQSVPIAVNAITADSLEKQGATRLTDIGNIVPNLVFSRAGDSAQVYLRGIGTSSTTTGNAATIASYIDGVYVASANAMLFSLNSIQRVEVLKGPQGTLFGRNATGGLTHIITNDPGPGTSGKVSVGYGNYDTVNGAHYVSTGNDTIAGDISLTYTDQNKGWGRNIFDPADAGVVVVNGNPVTLPSFDRRAGALNEFGARSKIVFRPSDRTTFKLAGMYSRMKSDQGIYRHGIEGVILSGDGVTPYIYNGGFYNYDSDAPWIGRNKGYLFSAEAAHEADFATLKSISSYQFVSSYVFFPTDGTPIVNSVQVSTKRSTRALTQELQLLSNGESGPDWLEYTAGLYFIHIDARDDGNRVTRGYFLQDLNERIASQKTNGYAAYAQVTASLTSATRLTLGLRYSEDRLKAEQYVVGLDATTVPPPPAANRPGQISRLVEPQKKISISSLGAWPWTIA